MKIQETPIDKISPYFKNAKEHKDAQVKKVANSIREFGFNQPIVVDKEGVIIVGHGRYLAAQLLGMEKVPTLILDIDDERAKAYRLADNKLNESPWKMDLVIEELKTISMEMIDLTGFDSDLILETKEDFPDLAPTKHRSELGDIYELGQHRLICGDSTDPETYNKLLEGSKARLIFTDPPYAVDYEGSDGKIENDAKTPEEALEFYKKVATQLHSFSTDDANLYWWYASRLQPTNEKALLETGWHVSQICIWLKEQFVFSMGQNFHRIYEPCMVAWKEGKPRYKDSNFSSFSELWTVGEAKTFADHLDVWFQKRDKQKDYIHPTQKPVQLAERRSSVRVRKEISYSMHSEVLVQLSSLVNS